MSEVLKNKDGVVIKPKQVWGGSVGEAEVIGFRVGRVVAHVPHRYDAWGPESSVFMNLIKSHDGADLEQARKDGWKIWVEGMEELGPDKIESAEFFETCNGLNQWYGGCNLFLSTMTYRYKLRARKEETAR
jgi:hypothetical protein